MDCPVSVGKREEHEIIVTQAPVFLLLNIEIQVNFAPPCRFYGYDIDVNKYRVPGCIVINIQGLLP